MGTTLPIDNGCVLGGGSRKYKSEGFSLDLVLRLELGIGLGLCLVLELGLGLLRVNI